MPDQLSEQYRIAALRWVELDAAARLLEETKSAFLSRKMSEEPEIPLSHAERNVKGSADWQRFVTEMVRARTDANEARVEMDFVRMKFSEQQSHEATSRAEMRL
jgi:hypothetical protein